MDLLSRSTFGVARVFMALAVFFCHVFEPLNRWGFLFVGVFFFMSGFGMECSRLRMSALRRSVPYLFFLALFTFFYWLVYRVFPYPSSWFLYVYLLVMVIYRFLPFRLLPAGFLGFALVLYALGFESSWYASFGAFLVGCVVARCPGVFTFTNSLLFLPGFLLVFYRFPLAFWFALPFFAWIVLRLSSFSWFRPLSFFGRYTFFFYCVHCFFLGLFSSTWTLGGSPSFYGVLGAFLASCGVSWLLSDFLFKWR